MNTDEINAILKPLPIYGGAWGRDDIPPPSRRPIAYVINLDKSSGAGWHWVSLYLDANACAEYYDPIFRKPLTSDITNYIIAYAPGGCRYSNFQRQSNDSNVCGLHAVFYVRMKAQGRSLCEIETVLSRTNTKLADRRVLELA